MCTYIGVTAKSAVTFVAMCPGLSKSRQISGVHEKDRDRKRVCVRAHVYVCTHARECVWMHVRISMYNGCIHVLGHTHTNMCGYTYLLLCVLVPRVCLSVRIVSFLPSYLFICMCMDVKIEQALIRFFSFCHVSFCLSVVLLFVSLFIVPRSSVSLCLWLGMCLCGYIYINIYKHTYMYIHIYTYMHIYIYIYRYTYTCTYIYVYMYAYISHSVYGSI